MANDSELPTISQQVTDERRARLLVSAVIDDPNDWEPIAVFNQYDLPFFPIDTLPDWMADFATGLATTTQTPLDMAAILTLTNCSAAIAGKVVIEAKSDWREPANLYSAIILDVGERKTAVHDACKA